MDFRDLRYFEIAAELGHVRQAAEYVHRTQPAITKSIKRLEAELDARLFERIGRNIRLTEVGSILLTRARLLRQAMEEASREVREYASGAAGHVRVGASATALEFVLPPLATALVKELPHVTLDIAVGMNDGLCALLKDGQLDLVVCPMVRADPALATSVIAKDPVVVVASTNHPLFRQRSIKLADLCKYRWVLPADSVASRTWLNHVFHRRGLPEPMTQIRSGSISLAPRLIAGTELLSYISRRNLRMANVSAMLREVPLRATIMQRDFVVAWRANAYVSPAAARLRGLAETQGRRILAG